MAAIVDFSGIELLSVVKADETVPLGRGPTHETDSRYGTCLL